MTTHSNVLRGIIEKAWNNGWHWKYTAIEAQGKGWLEILQFNLVDNSNRPELNSWIFDHDFAKALCKKGTTHFIKNGVKTFRSAWYVKDSWRNYLKGVALAEDRIKYLSKFL